MQLSSTRRQLTELRAELEQAQIKVDRQMRAVLLASQEVSKLDKLHDKQFEVYQSDAKKAEDLRIEELVSTGVVRRSVV